MAIRLGKCLESTTTTYQTISSLVRIQTKDVFFRQNSPCHLDHQCSPTVGKSMLHIQNRPRSMHPAGASRPDILCTYLLTALLGETAMFPTHPNSTCWQKCPTAYPIDTLMPPTFSPSSAFLACVSLTGRLQDHLHPHICPTLLPIEVNETITVP